MGKSLKEYFAALGKWGWAVAVVVGGGIYGILSSYLTSSQHQFVMPIWGWWLILVLALLISPFIAFHKMRLKRDELKLKLDERNKNREIADQLAEFARQIERFRDEEAANLLDVEEYVTIVEPCIVSTKKYLEENCGTADATLFNTVIDYSDEVKIQLSHKLKNLLKIIEFYRQRSNSG